MHEGHRSRILKRLEEAGESLNDHELLEILLFNAIPRKNTNGTAHNLLRSFGTLKGVLQADIAQLMEVEGVGRGTASYLHCIGAVENRIRFSSEDFPLTFNFGSYSEYLKERLGGLSDEVLEIYCLDSSERLKCTKRFTTKSMSAVRAKTDEVSRFLAMSGAHGVVVAHNHPRTSSTPSKEDDEFTKEFAIICSLYNIKFYDHMIVGQSGVFSYFRQGRMDDLRKTYAISNLIGAES